MSDSFFASFRHHLAVPARRRRDIIAELRGHIREKQERSQSLHVDSGKLAREAFGDPIDLAEECNAAWILGYRFLHGRQWLPALMILSAGFLRIVLLGIAEHLHLATGWYVQVVEVSGPILLAMGLALLIAYQRVWDRSASFHQQYGLVIASELLVSGIFIIAQTQFFAGTLGLFMMVQGIKIVLYLAVVPLSVQLWKKLLLRRWEAACLGGA